MTTEELRSYRFTCEDTGSCSRSRSITIHDAADEHEAARQARRQGWVVIVPRHASDNDEFCLCPEHFAEAREHWRKVDYQPPWLNAHLAQVGDITSETNFERRVVSVLTDEHKDGVLWINPKGEIWAWVQDDWRMLRDSGLWSGIILYSGESQMRAAGPFTEVDFARLSA